MVKESLTRALFFTAGTVCLLIGVIGVFIPILPTTPFLLLSAACFLRSSKRMYNWLFSNRFFGEYLMNYREGRGLSLGAKLFTLALLWLTISYSALYIIDFWVVQALLFIIAIAVSAHIILLPTLRKPKHPFV
ncbi:hypothetical protein A3K78_01925 [Candidatus Bathyarchaeota archaeon RBG_13_52_12]|nr:MAG: hypothetical protein A3K78_01925 [Candidatus Bathyarchaeota archaeon RBG_13_52_12]